ncbi:hypothetical protein MJO29_006187 [Puccinia striiformis f. sp. tritici]|nr:hypothetical protein MJO29_006187 [Puccinia striiformis f. sp. tritici]
MSNFDRACVRRPNVLTFNKFNHFLQDGTELSTPSTTNLHILSAWKESTLLGHNCAVKKYLQFNARRSSTRFRLPLSPCDIEAFCMWAGRNAYTDNKGKINGTSLKKYLVGLKAWHTIHGVPFPEKTRGKNMARGFPGQPAVKREQFRQGACRLGPGRLLGNGEACGVDVRQRVRRPVLR